MPEPEAVVNSSGSTLAVNGRLIIEDSATISGVEINGGKITIEDGGEIIINTEVVL